MDKRARRQALVLAAAAKGTNSIYRYRARPWLGSLPPDVANRICLHMASMRPRERSAAAGGGVEWTPVDYRMAFGDRPVFLNSYGAVRSTCRALRDFSNNGPPLNLALATGYYAPAGGAVFGLEDVLVGADSEKRMILPSRVPCTACAILSRVDGESDEDDGDGLSMVSDREE